jgi:hypothetical protein
MNEPFQPGDFIRAINAYENHDYLGSLYVEYPNVCVHYWDRGGDIYGTLIKHALSIQDYELISKGFRD